MRNSLLVSALSLALAACVSEAPKSSATELTCGTSKTLSGAGIGALGVGAAVDDIRTACQVLTDTTLERGNEGMPERRMDVQVGSDTVQAIVDADTVRRVEITTPGLRTADSLGVGTTAGVLRKLGAALAVGDRGVFAIVPSQCGLSFRLGGITVARGASWSGIPDSTPVDLVLLYGCTAR